MDRCAFAMELCIRCSKTRYFVGNVKGNPVFFNECQCEVEMRIPGTRRVADIGVVHSQSGCVIAVVEVFHTHAVDTGKLSELKQLGIPVLEVTSENVCFAMETAKRDNHCLLKIKTTQMKYSICEECEVHAKKLEAQEELHQSVLQELQLWQSCEHAYQDKWYAHGWNIWRAWERSVWNSKKRKLRAEGRDHAMRIIEQATGINVKKLDKSKRFLGKCVACNQWMQEGMELSSVSSSICVHKSCTLLCRGCKRACLLTQIATYGMCLQCNLR